MIDLEQRLRSRGCRLTSQREAVLEVLEENQGRPLRPEDIHALAAKRLPGMGLTTVYRTLELFCELGIIAPVHLASGRNYFEVVAGKHRHYMECISCGGVETIEVCMIEELADKVRSGSDFQVTSHCLSLFGYCGECSRKGVAEGHARAGRGWGAA